MRTSKKLTEHGRKLHKLLLQRSLLISKLEDDKKLKNSVDKETLKMVNKIDALLDSVGGCQYKEILPMRIKEGLTDEKIAEKLCCDVSTIRRNRTLQLNLLAVRYYGVEALECNTLTYQDR